MKNNQLFLRSGYVFNPDKYYAPSYRISPFRTSDIPFNSSKLGFEIDLDYFDNKIVDKNWSFTMSGKSAINHALKAIGLTKSDCVTILTTSGNDYISSCVTREIEKFCTYSREIKYNTKAFFINHEFGYPYENIKDITKYNLPIIEDACHTFLSDTKDKTIGKLGNFVIYSLPKIFPIQFGGILYYDNNFDISFDIQDDSEEYIRLSLLCTKYVKKINRIKKKRLQNYHLLNNLFSSIGCNPFFKMTKSYVPGVFMFKVPFDVNLTKMKEYGWAHGIECSVFYGEKAFFIPVHDRLEAEDLYYLFNVFRSFLGK